MKKKIQKLYETTCPSNTKFTVACLSSPECDLYAASDEAKAIYIWKRGRETPLITLVGNSSGATSLILNSADAELYAGLKGGQVVIWDLESSKVKYNLQGHSTEISSIAMSKCENIPTFLASASVDGKIKWWDLRAKGSPLNLKGHISAVRSLAISPDCNFIASGAEDGLVRLWDVRANKLIRELTIEDQGTVNTVEFNPCSYTLAYGSNDKLIKHWDLHEFSLISVTPIDRLPIKKLKFDHTGENIFSGTNETLKYWNIDVEDTKLLYMTETSWNKLQDMQYVEDEAIYAVNTYGNKIGYYMIPYDIIINATSSKKSSSNVKRAQSDVMSEFNYVNDNIAKHINNMQSNMQSNNYERDVCYSNNSNNKILNEFYTTESIFYTNQNDNVFVKNALNKESDYFNNEGAGGFNKYSNVNNGNNSKNVISINNFNTPVINKNEIILQKNVVINNISSNVNMSSISNKDSVNETFQIDLENFLDPNRDRDNNIFTNITTTSSFAVDKSNEPLGLDLNKFLQNDQDETMHEISQTNDLPLLQEINEQHQTIKGAISKRHNSLRMVAKWWSESNISSALNAINLMKDKSIVNDFFMNALISREDVNKIPFTNDHAISMLPLVLNLISTKYEAYQKTGCKTGSILLRIFSDKISIMKSNYYGNDVMKKCETIVDLFDKIFLKCEELRRKVRSSEISSCVNSLYTDLEFFLKPLKNKFN